MTATSARVFLLKIKDNGGTPAFVATAGLRTRELKINSELVDVTNADSTSAWREILDGAGVSSISAGGSGVATDKAGHGEIIEAAIDKSLRDIELIVPGIGKFTGKGKVSSYGLKGEYNGAVMFDLSIESSGVMAFTIEP